MFQTIVFNNVDTCNESNSVFIRSKQVVSRGSDPDPVNLHLQKRDPTKKKN